MGSVLYKCQFISSLLQPWFYSPIAPVGKRLKDLVICPRKGWGQNLKPGSRLHSYAIHHRVSQPNDNDNNKIIFLKHMCLFLCLHCERLQMCQPHYGCCGFMSPVLPLEDENPHLSMCFICLSWSRPARRMGHLDSSANLRPSQVPLSNLLF